MSYGYETKMTPLQILAFYNAVANNGKMVKPRLVKEIRDNGALVKEFTPEILNPMIVSKETLGKAQKMLEGVCETGTGRSLQNPYFKLAGKTGTAQIAGVGGYQKGMYLASFAGYFPADNPKYSMIVTFNNPKGAYYGGSVAGPVFKEIAEKVYASQILMENIPDEEPAGAIKLPDVKKGKSEHILRIAKELEIENIKGTPQTELALVKTEGGHIVLADDNITPGIVPDVRGMGVSDAIFLLENAGLNVKVNGVGKVKVQSLNPGTKCRVGQTVYLTLS
jgi:cell division protein FtsI (penicillin-binding protein 3)